ncbi:hypothetical protein K402DRAFT_42170 [Aulographum hederae CBS 113979]|uniref:Uncharacterized protein n=1 Tax=Aulographum hederae CBS 113979 TaxID=1176131 RepID=A0A6G1H3F5_9PEZI|nr:hypothetical protein K402DRAFT_42170 [Aulographum hederae CBS 113979]
MLALLEEDRGQSFHQHLTLTLTLMLMLLKRTEARCWEVMLGDGAIGAEKWSWRCWVFWKLRDANELTSLLLRTRLADRVDNEAEVECFWKSDPLCQ